MKPPGQKFQTKKTSKGTMHLIPELVEIRKILNDRKDKVANDITNGKRRR